MREGVNTEKKQKSIVNLIEKNQSVMEEQQSLIEQLQQQIVELKKRVQLVTAGDHKHAHYGCRQDIEHSSMAICKLGNFIRPVDNAIPHQ